MATVAQEPGEFFPRFLVIGWIPTITSKWNGRRDRIQAVIVSLPVRQSDAERCGVMSVSLNIGEALVVAAVHASLHPGKPT